MQMKYYLNPTPNDRNMEFDPSQNLFTNLPTAHWCSAWGFRIPGAADAGALCRALFRDAGSFSRTNQKKQSEGYG